MQNILFEHLENAGLVRRGQPQLSRIYSLTAEEIAELGSESELITSVSELPREQGAFAHSATLSLGGGRTPCATVECRMRHADRLTSFATLLSDRVYVHNFLSDHADPPPPGDVAELDERRAVLAEDIHVLLRLRPLIEANLVVPVSSTAAYCDYRCIALGAFGPESERRFERERRRLEGRYLREVEVFAQEFDGKFAVECFACEELLEHGTSFKTYLTTPAPLARMPRLLQSVRSGKRIRLSSDVKRKLGGHKDFADEVLRSIMFEMATAQALGTAYLSERELPIKVLNAISGSPLISQRNEMLQRHLTVAIPFAADLPLGRLIQLRQREEEAFLLFRRALTRAADHVKAEGNDLLEKHAQQIYSDVIAPELARLDRTVITAKRGLVRSLGRSATAWVGAISFGMYTGMLPAELLAAAKALGMTKILADLGETAAQLRNTEANIQSEDMYFLWKVRELSRAHSESRLIT